MKLVIKGELTDLNTYIRQERSNRLKGHRIKKEETENCAWAFVGQPSVTTYPVILTFTWYTKDLRKDCDNVAFAKKFILDGLVLAGVLKNDSRRYVAGFGGDWFDVDSDNPRVEIHITPYQKPRSLL